MLKLLNKLKNFLIRRHRDCVGIRLFRYKNLLVEVWFCPPAFAIEEHRHPHIDIELTFLYGYAYFYRRHRDDVYGDHSDHIIVKSPYDTFTTFSLTSEHFHRVCTMDRWLVFLNREYWKIPPTSAAEDFILWDIPTEAGDRT